MDLLPIKELPFSNAFPVKARILSKGNIRTIFCYEYSFEVLEVILIDESDTIYLEVKGPHLLDIAEMIVSDATYILKDYTMMCATEEGHGRRNLMEMLVTSPDQIRRCEDVEIPPADTIAQLREHFIWSPKERFFRNAKLLLTFVDLSNSTYSGCKDDNCRKGLEEHPEGGFVCAKGCKKKWDSPVTRYCLQVRFQDDTGSINAVCFDEAGAKLLKMTAENFQRLARDNRQKATGIVNDLINKMYHVRVQIKLSYVGLEFHSAQKHSFIISGIRHAWM